MAHYFGSLYFRGTLEMVQCATTMVHSTIDGTLHGKLVNHTFDFENGSLVLLFSPPCPPICPKISPKFPQNLECTKKMLLAHWFGNVPQMIFSYFWVKTKIWKFLLRWSQSEPKWHRKNYGVPKKFYWPIGLEMSHKWFWATFERKLKFEHFSQVKSECAKMT